MTVIYGKIQVVVLLNGHGYHELDNQVRIKVLNIWLRQGNASNSWKCCERKPENAQGAYSEMHVTGALRPDIFRDTQIIHTKQNQTQKNKFIKITDSKKKKIICATCAIRLSFLPYT